MAPIIMQVFRSFAGILSLKELQHITTETGRTCPTVRTCLSVPSSNEMNLNTGIVFKFIDVSIVEAEYEKSIRSNLIEILGDLRKWVPYSWQIH
jgi:hypothetical protein